MECRHYDRCSFDGNAMRFQFHALAYNLSNILRLIAGLRPPPDLAPA